MNAFSGTRARNTHVEATLNHPCPAQVRVGKISAAFKRAVAKRAPEANCFTIFAEGRTLDFECIEEFADSAKARTALAWAFDKVIAEARGTKIFVDKTGAPIARTAPKKRLRMIVGAH